MNEIERSGKIELGKKTVEIRNNQRREVEIKKGRIGNVRSKTDDCQ